MIGGFVVVGLFVLFLRSFEILRGFRRRVVLLLLLIVVAGADDIQTIGATSAFQKLITSSNTCMPERSFQGSCGWLSRQNVVS